MHKQPVLDRLKFLLLRLPLGLPKHQLGLQAPFGGHLPLIVHPLVDDGVVVLQVASEPVRLQRGPDDVLGHAGRVLGPLGELVRVDGKG